MSKLIFQNSNDEWVELEIKPHRRIEITDSEDNRYEIRPAKFGGIEVIAVDGAVAVEPKVSNQIVIKTVI